MAQRAKPIDLTRTYLPIDPNSMPRTMHGTEGEDRPDKIPPVAPYEGWNFMPTGYGYKSYFGLSGTLEVSALPDASRTRDIFNFQKTDLTNVLIALCDDGIRTKQGESTGEWTVAISLTDPNDGSVYEWSWCIIDNLLYVYRQGEDFIWSFDGTTWTPITPTTLNMAGQLGIFKAGSRLGIWDSANAIGHSSFTDKSDFTPSIATGANISSINDLIGKIINIVQHGEGFIVYATKSIIAVHRDPNNTFLWKATPISTRAGIAYRGQVAVGEPDSVHFAWTSIGLMKITNFQAEVVAPELYDYLKESNDPVYLKMLEGRYLFVSIASDTYTDGQITFYTGSYPATTLDLTEAINTQIIIDGLDPDVDTLDSDTTFLYLTLLDQTMPHIFAYNAAAMCTPAEGLGVCVDEDYPRYKELWDFNGISISSMALLKEYVQVAGVIDGLPADDLSWQTIAGAILSAMTGAVPPFSSLSIRNGQTGATVDSLSSSGQNPAAFVDNNYDNFFAKAQAITSLLNKWDDEYVNAINRRLAAHFGETTYIELAGSFPIPFDHTQVTSTPSSIGLASVFLPSFTNRTYPTITTPVGSRLLFQFKANWEVELGILDDKYAWAICRCNEQHTLDYGIYSTQYRKDTVLRVVAVSATAQYVGYSHADIPINDTYTDLAAALDTLKADIATYTGLGPIFIYNTATGISNGIPYVDGLGAAAYDDSANYQDNVQLTHNTGDLGVTVQLITTRLRSEDYIDIQDYRDAFPHCLNGASSIAFKAFTFPYEYVQYGLDGAPKASENTPPEAVIASDPTNALVTTILASVTAASHCAADQFSDKAPTFNGVLIDMTKFNQYKVEYAVNGDDGYVYEFIQEPEIFTYPGGSFLMQAGAATPYDILWEGAFVYDSHLKKWGKMKAQWRQLFDFSPINATNQNIIPYTTFGIRGAILNDDGYINLFDANPIDSYIKFGKYGSFRFGFTTLEEIRAEMRRSCTGSLEIETSLDGKTVDVALTQTFSYSGVNLSEGIGNNGRWHNISFIGEFDLSYLECRSWTSSRR